MSYDPGFAAVHAIRIAKAWEVTIGGTSIAMWVSYIAIGVSVFMSYALLKGPTKKG